MIRSTFHVVTTTDNKVYVVDDCLATQAMSVTNDAENVVKYLLKDHPGHRIIYKDTEGQWDELKHDGSEFIGFAPYKGWTP